MQMNLALKVHAQDNVATIFAEGIEDGTVVAVLDKRGIKQNYTVKGEVPYGHKIALSPIRTGQRVIKYGEEIGIATRDIQPGEYVHIHNLDSTRGRGDWKKEEQ